MRNSDLAKRGGDRLVLDQDPRNDMPVRLPMIVSVSAGGCPVSRAGGSVR